MTTEHEQPPTLPHLSTTGISAPKYDDLMVSPPPAYCPPEGMAGPPFAFMRTASIPVQTGAFDAYGAHHTSPTSPTEQLNPEAQALVEQYTAYFTELFTTWIGYAVAFYTYGFPIIRWTSLFFIRGFGGWRETFLLICWFTIWQAPGLYFGILAKQVQDVAQKQKGERFKGEYELWGQILMRTTFWGTWSVMLVVKFASLLWITGLQNWWMWVLWAGWMGLFGI